MVLQLLAERTTLELTESLRKSSSIREFEKSQVLDVALFYYGCVMNAVPGDFITEHVSHLIFV